MERIDIYEDRFVNTGVSIPRYEKKPEGTYALVIFVCIFDLEGRMLIQRRSLTKVGWPGIWDVSVGGGVSAGENSLESAKREVLEELGLDIPEKEFTKLLTLYYPGFIQDFYGVVGDYSIEDLTLQEEEVIEAAFATEEEICAMMEEGRFIDSYKEFIDLLFRMKNKQGIH